ncbi:hypothetical protein CYLTODRAFT_454823 [Cylindrobasidium torrendii FP15055 ss-10]|uniref:Uncharacterized protein n=1 Tax=Cylindrobasidium torrendii FP15055 ss-10 TaxID=1314674 RepID=A0A0D7B916_9AGAR|nr:hypothetical protein CYLTODRAFT_454823 [Cylindrobasidium torrendii FP15055 ss-10]
MPTPYTEDCISLTGVFREPIGYPIYTDHNPLKPHASAVGMNAEELKLALFNQGNYVYLQADVYELFQGKYHAFIPPCDYILALMRLREQNEPQVEARARVKMKSGLEYQFLCSEDWIARSPIFLRHPITGIVTKHEHPYPAFPRIKFRSADPAFLTFNAASKEVLCPTLFFRTTYEPLQKCWQKLRLYNYFRRQLWSWEQRMASPPPKPQPQQIKSPLLPAVGSPAFQMSPGRRKREAEARDKASMHAIKHKPGLCDSCSSIESTSSFYRPKPILRRRRNVAPRPAPRQNPSRVAKTKSSDANAALLARRRRRVV